MPNIELLEKSMPVAPIRIAALGCRELAEEVDRKLVKFRKELVERKQLSNVNAPVSEPVKVKVILKNPFVALTFILWLM